VALCAAAADAEGMFESGIGPGTRSDRFGTWALITFLLLFATPFIGFGLLWLPLLACAIATIGAIGYGLVGLFVGDEQAAAGQGLLKAAVPTVIIGFVWALLSGDWNLG
jgi:hypothetical protein